MTHGPLILSRATSLSLSRILAGQLPVDQISAPGFALLLSDHDDVPKADVSVQNVMLIGIHHGCPPSQCRSHVRRTSTQLTFIRIECRM